MDVVDNGGGIDCVSCVATHVVIKNDKRSGTTVATKPAKPIIVNNFVASVSLLFRCRFRCAVPSVPPGQSKCIVGATVTNNDRGGARFCEHHHRQKRQLPIGFRELQTSKRQHLTADTRLTRAGLVVIEQQRVDKNDNRNLYPS